MYFLGGMCPSLQILRRFVRQLVVGPGTLTSGDVGGVESMNNTE